MLSAAALNARTATNVMADAMGAVLAVDVCRDSARVDETLTGLVVLIDAWKMQMEEYCADGDAENAAGMSAWIAVGWSVYREELLAMG